MLSLKKRRARRQEKIREEINAALDDIRPILRIDECALTLAGFEADSGTAVLSFTGACAHCAASVETFRHGIETRLRRRVSEIRAVRLSPATDIESHQPAGHRP